MLALKPYWGKPTVRNFREDDGNVGIIRSPNRAIVLLNREKNLDSVRNDLPQRRKDAKFMVWVRLIMTEIGEMR
jgi:hypothetical protein